MSFLEKVFGWRLDSNESNYFKYEHIFSVWHFVALAIIIGVIITLCLVAKKKDRPWHNKMFKVIAIILMALEILRITYRTIIYCCYEKYLPDHGNIYNWAEIISFALCSMATFFTIPTLLLDKEKWNNFALESIYVICLLGGVTALVYPDMLNTYYPIYHIMNVQTLVTHGLLVAVPVLLVVTGKLNPKLKNCWKPLLVMFIFSMIARIFSLLSDSSFMYMNNGIEVIPALSNRPLYTYYWIMVLGFCIWMMLCYLPILIRNAIRKKKLKTVEPVESSKKTPNQETTENDNK